MPKNKDLKRLVRARMNKTGESYTAALAQIVARTEPHRERWAELAGMSDEAVRAKTELDWSEWVRALDAIGAPEMSHRDIAKHVGANYPVSGWWAQTVTVGYERIRGLREVGQQRVDGTFDANKSRTFAVDVERLYRAFSAKAWRARWLEGEPLSIRSSRKNASIRATWHDGTDVHVHFQDKGPGKSRASVQHRLLPSRADADRMKALWHAAFDALQTALA